MKHFVRLFKEEDGQALTEYGLLLGLIAVGCITLIVTLGGKIKEFFTDITTAIKDL